MKKRWGIIVLLLLIGSVNLSYAALMETTWTATLPDTGGYLIEGTYYGMSGEVFWARTIFDDAGSVTHKWNDGVNGKADFGGFDDLISSTDVHSSSFAYADDVEVVLSPSLVALLGHFTDHYYATQTNYLFQLLYGTQTSFSMKADGVTVSFRDGAGSMSPGFYVYDNSPQDNYFNMVLGGLFSTTMSSAPYVVSDPPGGPGGGGGGSTVPEPATMLLLGSGLIGLVGFRRKFKK